MKIKFGDNSLNLKVDGSLANIDRGPRGYSAYEIAVQEGFVGTEEEWLASLVGPEGKQGKDGERGIQGPRGQQGDKGEKGDTGPQGDKGDTGDTGPQGDKGEKGDIGPQGEKGDTGPSNVLSIGSVTKGDEANATITGESPNQILNLVLPKGDKGEKGEKGDTGPQGETGATGNGILSIQKTATAGLVDTYTTTFTNGTTTTFDVTNGEDGEVTQKQLDETNENVSWLQTLTDQMPHVAGQGTDLSLQSVLNYRLMKFLPQGVSSQESTTGANILNNINYSLGNIDASGQDISSGNTYRFNEYIPINEQTTIYLLKRLVAVYYDENKEYISQTSSGSLTLTTPAGTRYARFRTFAGDFSTFNNTDYMVSLSSITSYEPYTDGPAPNPSYPYPVKNVTGENSLVISNSDNTETQTYQLSLGNIELNSSPDGTIRDQIKGSSDVSYNLFDKNNANILNAGITSSTIYSSANLRTLYMPIVGGKTYTVSKILSSRFRIGTTRVTPIINTPIYNYINADSNTYQTISTTSEDKYLCVYYYLNGTDTLTEQEILDSIQITEGSEAKPYFPYGQVGMWYKREYIGKVVLDGSETYTSMAWGSSGKYGYRTSINDLKIITSANEKSNIRSDYFTVASANGLFALTVPNYGICARVNQSEIIIRNDDTTTVNDFKTWLSTHNVIVWYEKAEYTDIPITNTTLINQLNNIYNNAHSYNGVTNITTTYEDGNEQMYLDIEALAKGGSTTTETDPIFSASASSGITSSDISNWNNKADVEDIPDLTDYVKNTDYATASKGGVIKIGNGNSITANGILYPSIYSYANYQNTINNVYISKGTLENVITGKNLADKNYVDTAISNAITNTLGGSY